MLKLKNYIELNPKEHISKGEVVRQVTMADLEPFNRDIKKCGYVKYKSGTKFRNGDTLLARITPCLENGKTSFVNFLKQNEVAVGSTEFYVLRAIEGKMDPNYLYYLSISKKFRKSLIKSMTGTSGRQRATKEAVLDYDSNIPDIDNQKSISHKLSLIDDMISVNNQINDNLLELAKAKFNQTYILPTNGFQKVPLGWERSNLDEIITFSNGYNFKRIDMLKAPEPLTYRIFKQGNILIGGGLNDFGTKSWILKSKVKNLDRFVLKKWDLLMAMTDMKNKVAILGNTALMNRNNQYILNQRVGLIRSNNYNKISQIYLFLLTNSKSFLYNIRSKAHSGVQVNLSTKDIKKINLIIAPEEVNNNFNRFAKPIFEKMMENQVDNLTLNEIKQALLNNFF